MVYSDKARELQRLYQREWRAKNKDKVQAKNRRYWDRKAMQEAEKKQEGEYERS